jgi:transposase
VASNKKNAKRLGAHLVFIDESGFLLIPPVRKTWSPRGLTPTIRYQQLRHRISVISGLSLSPKRNRLGLYFTLKEKNIQQAEICEFLRDLLKHLRGPVVVVWDNSRTHKGDMIKDLCHRFKRLHLERFPPYAPQLNPDEGVWSQAKGALANGRPDNIEELQGRLHEVLKDIMTSPSRLRACIHKSELPPFLT